LSFRESLILTAILGEEKIRGFTSGQFIMQVWPRVKLHHLLQKCSFFLIKLAAFLARGGAHMKLHGMTNED
jgi:hypothetical protein